MTMKPQTERNWEWQEVRDCQKDNKRKNKNYLRKRYRQQLKKIQ